MNQNNQYDPFGQTPQNPYEGDPRYRDNSYGQDPYGSPSQSYQQNQYNRQEEAYRPYEQEETTGRNPYVRERSDPFYDGAYVNGQKEPEEEKKKHRFLFWLIFLLALLVFLYSAFQLFKIFKANWDERREKDRIIEIGNIPDDPEGAFKINWEGLRAVNDQIKAWIIVPDTNISYPIVQTTDNEYYLSHTFSKDENYAGAVFIDYQNKPDFSDNNTFIYGHNVKHETMFSQLEKFMDKDFFDQHKYVYIFTPEQNYKCEIISFHSESERSPYYRFGITDSEAWKDYISLVTAPDLNGFVRSDVTMGESDRMATLSTCSFEINDAPSDRRYLMHLKLVPWIGRYQQDQGQGPSSK